MIEPSDELIVNEPRGISQRTVRLSFGMLAFAMALVLMVSFSIYASEAGDETRFAPLNDNSYMDGATFVGSERCGDCHGDEHDDWSDSLHPRKIQVATVDTVVAPWNIDVTIPVADGIDGTVTLTKNETGWFASLDDTGNHTYHVDYVLGGFGWKQRFVTQLGNSKYILPIQWNLETGGWVAYHASDWYDGTGEPKMIALSQSWDRRCAGCHATGVEVEFNGTSDEWTATYVELGIGCEGCHGPGSLHVSPPSGEDKKDFIWNPTDSTVCGNCHVRGDSSDLVGGKATGYPMKDGHSIRPGDLLADYYIMNAGFHGDGETSKKHHQQYVDYIGHTHSTSLSTIQENDHGGDSCLNCHSTDYILADEDDKPTVETAVNDIECSACHVSHGSDIDHDLRLPQEQICTQCHNGGDPAPGASVHHPQEELVAGELTNLPEVPGEPWMDGEVTCTDCHMPLTAKSAVEWDIASHTFYFISPAKSIEFGMPNSCTADCHQEGTPGPTLTDEAALEDIEEWEVGTTTLLEDAAAGLEAAKAALDAAEALGYSDTDFEVANSTYYKAKLAHDVVASDGTMVHNPDYSEDLLEFAIEQSAVVVTDLTPGSVTGVVKDADGKTITGAEIKIGEDVWATTGADGSFDFEIAPGTYDFDVYEGTKKKQDFTAEGVASGQATDIGDIKYKKEDDSPGFGMAVALLAVALIAVLAISERRR